MSVIDNLIKTAEAEIGYYEKANGNQLYNKTENKGAANYTKYGYEMHKIYPKTMDYPAPWCDAFVDWCFVATFGQAIAEKLLHTFDDYCPNSAGYFKNSKQWYSTPKKGDQIFFKDSAGTICHTGLVYYYDNNYVYTIEGNTNDGTGLVANGVCVAKKKYPLKYNRIAGYGRPYYNIIKEANKMRKLTDIQGHYAEKHIKELFEMGIVNGKDDGTYCPDEPITRADAAIIARNVIRYITGK